MNLNQLPLLDIFDSLRQRHGLPLGIDEYLVVLHSLQAGFGIENTQELEQLCCLVWAKSEEENRLIERLFQQMWKRSEVKEENENSPEANSTLSIPENLQITSTETPIPEAGASNQSLPNLEKNPTLSPEPVQTVQAVLQRRVETRYETPLQRQRYSLLTEYFPVTKREMKQIWRYLRRPVRQGVPIELDIEATVEKMGHEAILLEPVLMPPRINQTDLVLIIDQEGSMVPFHELSRQLVETAERGGRLKQTNVYYFHDYADEYLYRQPTWVEAQPLTEVLEEIGKKAAVLIVSDGGAARGNFDAERIYFTRKWIEQLQQSVTYCAWLNPMPSESWKNTTAGEIAGMLPMFEMNRQGMNAAITVLRGRYVAWETMYSWLV
ncbi:MAG: hypothetical protein KME60_24250 [Cyanomargarita calcarea GSE-NOS-MK-12-04C]|jgi:hypothetical protein|uniref:VWA containing CoxE family protein n=1 Tax=Cyanomargarita calcarea GSE-NOS-MK-12-04C TaxID=2839659 RepID=A0A951QRP4_9CYAN|nr:hypothetical protein [Cyanomargarita calcarea GSE-NOS-MK-12-04C]